MPRPRSEHPTPGELDVRRLLWRRGPCTVREVLEALNRTRRRAYTSVMSLLNVMVEKKLLRRRPQGRAFLYSARVTEERTLGRMVGDLVDRAFDGSTGALIAHALEQTEPTAEELEELQRLIEAHRDRKEMPK